MDPARHRCATPAGGSPAFTSWLPRTRVMATPAWVSRHAVKAASSAATRPAAACRKSPSTTSCVAPVRAISPESRDRSLAVAPRGTGTPPARNAAALPRCTSATNTVRSRGQCRARSAKSSTRSPPTCALSASAAAAAGAAGAASVRAKSDSCGSGFSATPRTCTSPAQVAGMFRQCYSAAPPRDAGGRLRPPRNASMLHGPPPANAR